MSEISIQIDWVYALGILGTLLVIAWQAGSRFARIETSLKNLNEKTSDTKQELGDRISELKSDIDNVRSSAYSSHSPIQLTENGKRFLNDSGFKEYIDTHVEELMERCPDKEETNPYEIQEFIFDMFGVYDFGEQMDDQLKTYAFNNGISMEMLRRVGAIYFRDIYMRKHNMDVPPEL